VETPVGAQTGAGQTGATRLAAARPAAAQKSAVQKGAVPKGAAQKSAAVQTPAVASAQGIDTLNIPDSQLEPVAWSSVAGWEADDHAAAFAAFMAGCKPFLAVKRSRDPRPVYNGLWNACRRAAAAKPANAEEARKFFEDSFRPVRIAKLGETTGLLTGYYEPIVDGSRFPNPEMHFPLYRRPPDLVVDGRKPGPGSFPNRATVGRLNAQKQMEPYHDRLAIEEGALDGQHLEICWIKDPFEAMSIQIQGSARVRLEDGTLLRINYDAHNGFGYTAVGRILIERNLVPRDEMSMDRIKRWMHANPDLAKEVRGTNRSFVFFRITGLDVEDEPTGAQGIPLHPGRSIAVDRTHVYGTPFFIDADLPIDGPRPATKFRRLMVAQDTGSAIQGPARADLYWGAGDEAGRVAGRIRHQGRFTVLVPRELDLVEAGKVMPLPLSKPPIKEIEARIKAEKDSEKKPDGKKTDPKKEAPKTTGPEDKTTVGKKDADKKDGDKKEADKKPNEEPAATAQDDKTQADKAETNKGQAKATEKSTEKSAAKADEAKASAVRKPRQAAPRGTIPKSPRS
jgi:membrane-bound lytic murein transglycosylase A